MSNLNAAYIKKVNVNAKLPTYSHFGEDAGADVYACDYAFILSGERKIINTGISIYPPKGTYTRVAPKSGLACSGIDIGAGVINLGNRNAIGVLVINNTGKDFTVRPGMKIAQIIFEKIVYAEFIEVDDLTDSADILLVKKLHPDAKLPMRQTTGSAGYDLYSLTDGIIIANSRLLIKTGIAIKLPSGTYGRIASRSGLSVKKGIEVGAGVIDEDYRYDVGVLLHNHGDTPFVFDKHTRIAQLIITPIVTPDVEEITEFEEDFENNRTGGFGSTGLA